MKVKDAVETLVQALNEDPGYRISWQANIAVQFQDSWQRAVESGGLPATRESIHEISNSAADSFLKLLCMEKTNESN